MRPILNAVLAAVVCIFSYQVTAAPTAPKSVTIGFIPGENPQALQENGEAIAKLLQAKIGVPVNIYVGKSYAELVDAMAAKKVDFAFLSAMTFVFAEKKAGAKVLLKKVWESPYYYATILSRGDQKLTKLSQLKGKRFAFVDDQSASGYLYPEVYFKKSGIDPKSFFSEVIFSGNHTESIKLLREGKVDAVAVFSNDAKGKETAWERFPGVGAGVGDGTAAQKLKSLKKPNRIWVSEPIPNDPFCVRQEFYDSNPKIAHELMFALLELDGDATEGANFKKLLGVSSLKIATTQQYEPVREMVKALDLKPEGK